jgi:hypothetical protein
MFKITLAAIAAIAIASASQAAMLDVTPHAGYSTVSMGALNHSNETQWGWEGTGSVNDIHSAYVVGVDLTSSHLTPHDWLNLGLRTEYLQTNQLINDGRPDNSTYNTDQGTLTNLLVGASASQPFILNGLQLGLGAWVGGGYGVMSQHESKDWPALIQSGNFTGYTLVGELESTISYALGSHLRLSFVGGWRWADFASMKDGNTPLYDNLQLWEHGLQNPVNVDFSGATGQGSVSYSF